MAAPRPASTQPPVPLYHTVYVVLRQSLLSGAFPAGEALPAEMELASRFGVSRITIRHALNQLAAEGLITRQQGRGTFPAQRPAAEHMAADLSGLFENLVAMGVKTTAKLISFTYERPTPDAAAALRLDTDELVQKAVRVRSHKGAPFSHLTTYVPERIGRLYSKGDLAARPLLALLEQAGHRAATAEQLIAARVADTEVGPRLDVLVGTPLLAVTRTVFDHAGMPIEYIEALYRSDRYVYKTQLARAANGADVVWRADN